MSQSQLIIPGRKILLLAILISSLSCKKNSDANLAKQLKGTAWAGKFYYTGFGAQSQVFSAVFGNDSTLTWYQLSGSYPGNWSVKSNKLTLNFLNGNIVTVDVSGNTWTDFVNVNNTGWIILNATPSAVPDLSQLTGTTWKGKIVDDLTIQFISDKLLTLTPTTPGNTLPYAASGAGIRFSLGSSVYYGVFMPDNKSLQGVEGFVNLFNSWDAIKQ